MDNLQQLNIKALLYRYLLGYWYLWLALPLLGVLIGFLYMRYQVPTYIARATLLVKDENIGREIDQAILFEDIGGQGRGSASLENEIQVLQSRRLMQEVVDSLQLHIRYFWEGRVRNTELYRNSQVQVDSLTFLPGNNGTTLRFIPRNENQFQIGVEDQLQTHTYGTLFSYGKLVMRIWPDGDPVIGKPMLIRLQPPTNVAQYYTSQLQVRPIGNSSVLQLSLEDEVPQRAEDVINKVMQVYNRRTVEEKNQVGRNTLKFIDERLRFFTEDLQAVEGNLESYKQQESLPLDPSNQSTVALGRITELEEQRTQAEVQKTILDNMKSYLLDSENEYELLPANLSGENPVLSESISQLNQLLLERAKLLESATPENPVIDPMDDRIASLRRNVLNNINIALERLDDQVKTLDRELAQLNQRIQRVPTQQRRLADILRKQSIKENIYLLFLEKREETALSLAVTEPNARIIDPAKAGGPIVVNRFSVMGIAAFGGLLLTLAIIAVLELLDDKIRTEEDLKTLTKVPLFGSILRHQGKETMVVHESSHAPIAEMFRLLRTNLQFLSRGEDSAVTLITSSTGGEGKTFVTVNLGMTTAMGGERTILLGLDLRKPKLLEYLDIPEEAPGLSQYLIGQASLSDIIQQAPQHQHLYYIGSGPIPPNPAELLLHERMEQLFEELRRRFDRILIDTPPVGLVTDALLLNPYISHALFVVKAHTTRKNRLQLINDIQRQEKLKRPAIILNGVKAGKRYGYGYGYGYGYYE